MPPDFTQKTIDTLAQRAAYKCSNPDCRVATVGPNTNATKSTVIGEAAHIFGARPGSKRYCSTMTDASRAEITNAIWLCRNCHKLIDTDEEQYSSNILFAWREQHEKYTQSELGSAAEKIQYNDQASRLASFEKYPPIIRRIIIDKPDGWEWRLTAELTRYLNAPLFRKIDDLRNGLYVKPLEDIEGDQVINWVNMRLVEAEKLVRPVTGLLDRLSKSWGGPDESEKVDEIYHITCLLRDYLEQIVQYEERVYFVNVPDEYDNLVSLLKDVIGSQIQQLAKIPEHLDEVVSLIGSDHEGTKEKPLIIEKVFCFDLPKEWNKRMNCELKRVYKYEQQESGGGLKGWKALLFIIVIIWLLSLIF